MDLTARIRWLVWWSTVRLITALKDQLALSQCKPGMDDLGNGGE